METGDWVQVVIAAIYVAILVVMILQRRDMQASAESAEARANEAMKHAAASAAAMRELAARHGRLAEEASASASAAREAVQQAVRANEFSAQRHEDEQRRREETRRTVALRILGVLRERLDSVLEWRHRWQRAAMGMAPPGARITVHQASDHVRDALSQVVRDCDGMNAYDQILLESDFTRQVQGARTTLERYAGFFAKTTDPDPMMGLDWLTDSSKALYELVVQLERIVDPDVGIRSWDDRADAAWKRVATGMA